ncbi:Sulfurtransferase [Fusobacterium sp. DD29]|uniref:rhodanese-like domain-containing protein n=1 Tax=unclassified Fusobacterium TaxID=2648384 RepID=UPI001B8C2F73|nr:MULTISPECIES: rhodanese-like domain-containing protein [unclassified Fusobacterium]MBR8701255.1 Sulfurtransferase [Fusobacterium sp. DD45]MBR8711023.1 Sulfurtransferase [Fusobacterium sp. DD28]MBR8749042.1 Sulfurtransferase [Fusobacterium sp. DD29]MBR8751597.1 Sulfurtransferase [Fusobacterium sp. DD26]MBR8761308.1 Sulfurtransferase [Fusobacterium sp. DD25]
MNNNNTLPYNRIGHEEAKQMMDEHPDYIILDVRTPQEFNLGHIENAINLPNEEIGYEPPEELSDMNKPLLVYCRSGHRSLHAALKLHFLGYKNIYEFGGINTWPYKIVK